MEKKKAPLQVPPSSVTRHPLEKSEASFLDQERRFHASLDKAAFGAYLPASIEMEKSIVAKVQRLPPLSSSNLAYEALTGGLYNIDRCNLPSMEGGLEALDGHRAMERKLKMT